VRSLADLTPSARRCIKSIKQTTHETMDDDRALLKVVLQVELHPKVQALDLLMAHFGLKTPEKIDVHVNVTSAKQSLGSKLDELRTRNRPEQPEPGGAPGSQPN
jgi:signal transduction histidine kinase